MDHPGTIRRCSLPPIPEAIKAAHGRRTHGHLPDAPRGSRLAFDELLAGQLVLVMVRAQLRRLGGTATPATATLRHRIIDALPYSLTAAQASAVDDITEDLRQPAHAAAGRCRIRQDRRGAARRGRGVEAGQQAALMAPTEILARQHIRPSRP